MGKKPGQKISGTNIAVNNQAQPDPLQAIQALINIFAVSQSKQDFLDKAVHLIRQESRCNFAGIRVLDKSGNIPYESYVGFSREFWEAENKLSVLTDECVCTRVVKERLLACDMQIITGTGSFYCNDVNLFIGKLTGDEMQLYRGVCVKYGFVSIAVIPIRYQGAILGAVHIADSRPEKFTFAIIEFIESITPLIGEALSRYSMETTLKSCQADLLLESSKRKQAELILQRNQKDLQSIMANIPDVICRFDKNLRFIYANAAITVMTGNRPEYYIGKTHSELEPQKDVYKICSQYIREVFESGESKAFEHDYHHNSVVRYYRLCFIPEFDESHTVKSVLNINQDITDSIQIRKQKEELLQAENRLFTAGPVIAYKRKPGICGRIEYISPNVNQFGYGQQDFLAGEFNIGSLIHPLDIKRIQAEMQAFENKKSPYFETEFRIRRADGEYRWVYNYKILQMDETGTVTDMRGYILDITERKNTEEALRISEKKYQELVEDANVIIMHLDEKGQILFINEFGLKLFAFQRAELFNRSLQDSILPQYESTGRNQWDVFNHMFTNPAKHERTVLENVKKDGTRIWIEWTNRFSKDPVTGRSQLITVGFDITARRKAEVSLTLIYERYRRNKLIRDMLENYISEDEFLDRAKREGLFLQTPVACCLITFNFSNSHLKSLAEDREKLYGWVETAVNLISAHLGGITWQNEQEIAVWQHIANQSDSSLSSWVDDLANIMKDFLRGDIYVIGVSTIHHEIKFTYRQAREALIAGPVFHAGKHVFYWRDLGVSKLILEHVHSNVGDAFIEEWLGPLVEIPSLKNEEWLWTLKELISGDTINAIANRLHIHPKTLTFRKRKIEQILRKQLDDSETRLNIAVALKLRQLQGKIQPKMP